MIGRWHVLFLPPLSSFPLFSYHSALGPPSFHSPFFPLASSYYVNKAVKGRRADVPSISSFLDSSLRRGRAYEIYASPLFGDGDQAPPPPSFFSPLFLLFFFLPPPSDHHCGYGPSSPLSLFSDPPEDRGKEQTTSLFFFFFLISPLNTEIE